MPLGTAHRVTGLLVTDGHGFALDVDGGGRWRLDVRDDRVAAWLAGLRVTVIGRRAGFDLLEVDAIKPL